MAALAFECTRCGKCCISSGSVIRIGRKISERSFGCRCMAGGEQFVAVLEPGIISLFRKPAVAGACPFLRMQEKVAVCVVYGSRPGFCRDFRCYSLRILDTSGNEIGRVKGRRTIDTGNSGLREFWHDHVTPLDIAGDEEWMQQVIRLLAREGYRAET